MDNKTIFIEHDSRDENFKPGNTFLYRLQRYYEVLKDRAIHPDVAEIMHNGPLIKLEVIEFPYYLIINGKITEKCIIKCKKI